MYIYGRCIHIYYIYITEKHKSLIQAKENNCMCVRMCACECLPFANPDSILKPLEEVKRKHENVDEME